MSKEELSLESLSAKFEAMSVNIVGLQAQNKALQENNETLAEQNKALHAQNAELKTLALSTVSGNGEGRAEVEKSAPKLPSDPTFKHNGKRYEILIPACEIPGVGYRTADEIIQDQSAQAALLKSESPIIRLV